MTHFPYEHLLPHLDAHYQGMPPVAAMQVSIAGFDGDCLRLDAPLDRNVNDKGCAFGGSLASLMTLAAWGVVTLRVQGAGMHCIAVSTMRIAPRDDAATRTRLRDALAAPVVVFTSPNAVRCAAGLAS